MKAIPMDLRPILKECSEDSGMGETEVLRRALALYRQALKGKRLYQELESGEQVRLTGWAPKNDSESKS